MSPPPSDPYLARRRSSSSLSMDNLPHTESAKAAGQSLDRRPVRIGESDTQMMFVAGSEIAAGQAQHAALDRKRLGDRSGRNIERVPQEGEIGADGVELPAFQAGHGSAEPRRPGDDLLPVLLPPSGQRFQRRGQRMLPGARRADLDAVHDLGKFRQETFAGNYSAQAMTRDAEGFSARKLSPAITAPKR